ncbi:IS66 family insertion sequence element accessory protein TnpB, partial [Thiolapillus sp.]|uniref:IS66 family insertion sequence element accessory protein TnpB n=1 Tax=Thiolapillus sp. TaxID=2017437 RepID=UPI003AF9767A
MPRIYLYRDPVDFRKSFRGLAAIVEQELGHNPQACLRPRDRFWDIPVPKIDSAFDNLLVPQPSWSPSTTQQLRKLVAAPYLPPNDWTPRSDAYFVFPLAQGTPGKQCGLAATGVYQPSLRSPWLAAFEGALYAFTNRRRDKIKLLYWEDNGFVLYYKSLAEEKFH